MSEQNSRPDPQLPQPKPSRTSRSEEEVAELVELCRRGRLFDVQDWIKAGKSLQLAEPPRQRKSALRVAVEAGNHSLVQVLLLGGYDPNLERDSPLTWALVERRDDLVDLLLQHGCEPQRVGLHDLFNTYDRKLLKRFYELGVDFTVGHELAGALAHASRNRPLYGFVKHYREHNASIARELQIALHTSIDENSEVAIALCLWAGAEPRKPAPTLSMASDDSDDDDGGFDGWTAVEHAVMAGNLPLLKRLGPSPKLDNFESLHMWTRDAATLAYLFSIQVPRKPGAWLARQMWSSLGPERSWSLLALFEKAFASGLRWTEAAEHEVTDVRRSMLKADSHLFRGFLRLLCQGDHCSTEILQALARSPAFRQRLSEEGYLPGDTNTERTLLAPTGRREVQALLGIKQPKPPPPSLVHIGGHSGAGREVISRRDLFEKLWNTPMRVLATHWGLSDRGLAKACARVQVPVPPRGYWARVQAGQKMKPPKLPAFKGTHEPRIEVPATRVAEPEPR